ncbi:hypothetical protein [Glutamicibacter arilaitensis]|uniref:hypothetical protein n=1 Tax=Glutamicibacter arilaitensis TaxID=256701 RepID=UPI0038503DF3
MSVVSIAEGMTCHIGKGKTVWEIIKINGATHTVELSALGKGGYSNRSASVDDLTHLEKQTITTPLGRVITARISARNSAHNLHDRLRFSNPTSLRLAAVKAFESANAYIQLVEAHNADLADLGIKAED